MYTDTFYIQQIFVNIIYGRIHMYFIMFNNDFILQKTPLLSYEWPFYSCMYVFISALK